MKTPDYHPTESQKEQTCHMCGGSNTNTGWRKGLKKELTEVTYNQCICNHDTPQEMWESICWYLNQFIRCKIDNEKECAGCEVERQEILSRVFHYGKLMQQNGDVVQRIEQGLSNP